MNSDEYEIPSDVPRELVVGFARCRQLENWIRELVYLETKSYFGSRYWDECSAALNRAGDRVSAERYRDRDRRHAHMALGENDPLWFTSFESLTKILFDKQLWPYFEPYLTTEKLLAAKLDEVSLIRNRIAHNRSLHQHDLDRLLLILRELDRGAFSFYASYEDSYRFDPNTEDEVYRHFASEADRYQSHERTTLDIQ